MRHWYLVRTKASAESVAESHLGRQGYEIYLPRVKQPVLRAGHWRECIAPLFPRYLFLRLNEACQALAPVRSTTGVSEVVRFGSAYAVVPDRVVCDLQKRADPISGLHRLNREPRWTPGAKVKIFVGPLDGFEGVFERVAGADRVVLLLKLLGRDTRVCVPRHLVLPAHA